MQEADPGFSLLETEKLAQYRPFVELTEAWYSARCAAHGSPRDNGEAHLAKIVVRDWLISEVADGQADRLEATDLPFVWLNAHFPEGLDADRMITALVEWILWIGGCGLFVPDQTERFVRDLESSRASFVRWSKAAELPSASVEGDNMLAAFTWWQREQKGRPFEALLAGQASLTAAINLMGDVNGDLRAIDLSAWFERAAYVLMEDAHDVLVRDAVHDVIRWYGVTGVLTLRERNRIHREVSQAHQRLVREAQLRDWASVLSGTS